MTGGSPGSGVVVRVGVVARRGSSSPWRWWPGGAGSRSMPAASMAASCLGVRARPSPGRRPAARPTPSSAGGRDASDGRAVRFHPSSVASQRRISTRCHAIDPVRRPRDPSAPGLPDLYRLAAVGDRIDLGARSRSRSRSCSRTLLRHAGGGIVRDGRRRDARRRGGRAAPAEAEIPFMPARVILQDFTGVPAVVDLAAMRDAMADLGGDPARVNPLVPADLVIDHSVQVDRFGTPRRVRLQRRARVRAQRRALPAAALGADGVPRPAGRAARDRHRPPGQPRVPGDGRHRPRRTRDGRGRLPRHARRHRLAHDDDQRPRRARLRRRRHRGRGRPARPAALPADAARRRRPPRRRAAARLDGDRPRARRDRDAARVTASSGRSSSSPATGWPACRSPTGRRSAT